MTPVSCPPTGAGGRKRPTVGCSGGQSLGFSWERRKLLPLLLDLATRTTMGSSSSHASLRQALNSYREIRNMINPSVQDFYHLSTFEFLWANLQEHQGFSTGWELLFRDLTLTLLSQIHKRYHRVTLWFGSEETFKNHLVQPLYKWVFRHLSIAYKISASFPIFGSLCQQCLSLFPWADIRHSFFF